MIDVFVASLFILVLFLGLKSYKKPEYNSDNFSLDNCNAIKAICALVVVFCHISNYVSNSYLIKILDGFGTFAVTVFFMFSGYGVMNKYLLNYQYDWKLLIIRISRLFKPYLLVLFMYVLYYIFNGYSVENIVNIDVSAFYTGDTIVINSWFVFVLVFLYALFFIGTKLFNKALPVLVFVFVFSTSGIAIMKEMNFCPCWYISLISFSFGCAYACVRNRYNSIIKHHYPYILTTNAMALIVMLYLNFAVYPNNSNIIFDQLKYIVFLNLVILLTIKYSLKNALLDTIYKYSYELYLVHGLVLMLITKYTTNGLFICVFGLLLSILVACLVNVVKKII